MWSVRASVSLPQRFRHVGTCVQILSPFIFCLVSVLSNISAYSLFSSSFPLCVLSFFISGLLANSYPLVSKPD